MRLTNDMRDRIVREATDAAFKARTDQRKLDEQVLAKRARDLQLTPAERKAVDGLPSKFFDFDRKLSVRSEEGAQPKFYITISLAEGVCNPEFISNRTHIISDELFCKDMETWLDSNKELGEDIEAFRSQTRAVLEAFTTVEKLLEHWPTLRDLMPAGFFVSKKPVSTLPTTTINGLDAILKATRPFPAEQAKVAA